MGDESVARIERGPSGLEWFAYDGDMEVGELSALVRPDKKCFAFLRPGQSSADEQLLATAIEQTGHDLHTSLDEFNYLEIEWHTKLGFEITGQESHYKIPVSAAAASLRGAVVPAGLRLISAADADEGRLRLLDDALRQDVPGTDGWQWDAAGFHAETYDSGFFDPALYLVAVDQASGQYAGLVRVWHHPRMSRLGLVAVLAPYRRRGLARAMLGQVLGVLQDRGAAEVVAEIADTNTASLTLLTSLGARRTGGSVWLIRKRPAGA
ncbi:MAG: GNAT family N-acetyltransferase [Actinomycetota bacterium]